MNHISLQLDELLYEWKRSAFEKDWLGPMNEVVKHLNSNAEQCDQLGIFVLANTLNPERDGTYRAVLHYKGSEGKKCKYRFVKFERDEYGVIDIYRFEFYDEEW